MSAPVVLRQLSMTPQSRWRLARERVVLMGLSPEAKARLKKAAVLRRA